MNALLPVAERMLIEHGEFYPYGGCMMLDGSITHMGANDSDTEYPKSEDMMFVLKDALKEMGSRRECKLVALVFDVLITLPNSGEKSDAIQLSIDHAEGYSVEVLFPYSLEDGELNYGEPLVLQGKHDFFNTGSGMPPYAR